MTGHAVPVPETPEVPVVPPAQTRPPIVLALAIAGSLAGARVHARTRATLDATGPTFVAFLLGVIVIVGGLIYFPMLILGPIGERIIG